jgi:hypothetical protein
VVHTAYGVFDTNPVPGQTIIPRNYGQAPGSISINMRISRTWGFGEKKGAAGPAGMGGMPPGGGFGGGGGGPRGGGGPGGGGPGGMMFGGPAGSKRFNLTLSANARNAINHVNLGQPSGNLSSPFFGQSTSLGGGFGPFANGAAGNRRIDLQLRLTF